MKIKEKLLKMLFENGLFEEQAEAVLERYLNSDYGAEMKDRVNEEETDYPPFLFAGVWLGVKAVAVEWIDENVPRHWARPMFSD